MARIDKLMHYIAVKGGSGLHVKAGYPVFIRIDGELHKTYTKEMSAEQIKALAMEIMPERNRKEWEQTNDTDFCYEVKGQARFRTNVYRDQHGPAIYMCLMPDEIMTLKDDGKMIQGSCPECGKLFKVNDDKGGKQGKCKCGAVITMPLPNEMFTDSMQNEERQWWKLQEELFKGEKEKLNMDVEESPATGEHSITGVHVIIFLCIICILPIILLIYFAYSDGPTRQKELSDQEKEAVLEHVDDWTLDDFEKAGVSEKEVLLLLREKQKMRDK